MNAKRLRQWSVLSLLGTACAGAPAATRPPDPAAAPTRSRQEKPLIPAGYGTLKQDEFTIPLRSGALLIKVTPLAEAITRTAAPDTYTRLHKLVEARRPEAQRSAGVTTPIELFLVTLFSYEPNVAYHPENIQLTYQGRQVRPVSILPITSGWGKQLLQQQQTQSAVYAFAGAIDYEMPITLRYGLEQSDAWTAIIPRIQVESEKVKARAAR